MGKPMMQLSMQISLFVEKGVQELARRKNVQITPFLAQSACWQIWHSQTTDWLLGGLGYPYKIISVQRASPVNGKDQFRELP